MKRASISTTTVFAFAITLTGGAAHSEEAPGFIQDTFPEQGIDAAWEGYQSVFMHPDSSLDAKTKELIALAVSAQIPCDYCVYYHTRAARTLDASDAEIREAVASGALIRKWSTMLNGSQYDLEQWQGEVDAMFPEE